jgi:tRNA pseudouridine13 synthase
MTEPTAAKRPRCDNGNGQHEQNDDENTISSSSMIEPNEDLKNVAVHTRPTSVNLMSEADRALQESNKRHIKPVVDEAKFGIELFVGDRTKQFHGLVKSRYADFIVHEVDLDGNTAQLTSFDLPDDEKPESPDAIKLENLFDRKVLMSISSVNQGLLDYYKIDVTGMDKEMRTSIHKAIKAAYDRLESSTVSGDSDVSHFKKQSNKDSGQKQQDKNSKESNDNSTQRDDPDQQNGCESKETGNDDSGTAKTTSVATNAEQESQIATEKKYILVKKQNKPSRPKNFWPKNRPDHTHFVLYKENKDTMDAIHNLAVATYTKPGQFNYAGTKDRRAVTTQWVSSWRLDPRRLLNAMRRFNRRPFLKVGNFCFKNDSVRLGQLRANKFDIVLRNLVHNSGGVEVIEDAMRHLKENGFVNYFGLQRFGNRSVHTHEIGLAILQGEWQRAVDLILSYRYDDSTKPLPNNQDQNAETPTSIQQSESATEPNTINNLTGFGKQDSRQQQVKRWVSGAEQHNACIDLWKSKQDADLVFKKYPHFKMTNEGAIIKSLSKFNESRNNYAMAVESLPRNTRSIYVHAYQSLLWNKITTFRLKNFGYKVIAGDLILRPDANISDNSLDVLLAVDETDTPDVEVAAAKIEEVEKAPERKMPVEEVDANIIIAEEKDLDKYTIFNVVLPLVGTKTRLPANAVGKELERLLAEDNLTLDSFRAREKAFISYGSYRKIMVRPDDLDWCLRQYSNPHQNLVDTDLDLLYKKGNESTSTKDQVQNSAINSGSSDEALIVSFQLPPSSYATMCLRELMKKPSTDFNNRF